MMTSRLGIYVHVPFCVKKCPYCGFYSRAVGPYDNGNIEMQGMFRRYYGQILDEIDEFADCNAGDDEWPIVDSVFFGGGTPAVMPEEQLESILNRIRKRFHVSSDCEITIEANPGTFSDNMSTIRMEALLKAGFNRISFGVQSMDDDVLKTLGRIHSAGEAEQTVRLARGVGFSNINMDLMFGIPGQTMEQWKKTLERALELDSEHISFYSLQLEEGTPFMEAFNDGRLKELPDELDREMYHYALRTLKDAGYHHYEISNAARPGFECRHNLKYWTGQDYVGFGDSAASYLNIRKYAIPSAGVNHNLSEEKIYPGGTRYVMMNGGPRDIHINTEFEDMSEYTFTGLRLSRGILYGEFYRKFGINFQDAFSDRWHELKPFFDSGDLRQYLNSDGIPIGLGITEKGIDISNKIMAVFV